MQKCKDDEHTWIVTGWAYGRYNEKGQFTESQQPNLFAMQAKEFMCQKCLARDKAERLFLIDQMRVK